MTTASPFEDLTPQPKLGYNPNPPPSKQPNLNPHPRPNPFPTIYPNPTAEVSEIIKRANQDLEQAERAMDPHQRPGFTKVAAGAPAAGAGEGSRVTPTAQTHHAPRGAFDTKMPMGRQNLGSFMGSRGGRIALATGALVAAGVLYSRRSMSTSRIPTGPSTSPVSPTKATPPAAGVKEGLQPIKDNPKTNA